MTQKAWDVFLNGLWIDTVFFNSNLDEDYVRNSLICHDHFHPDITLKVQKTMNPNFICRPTRAFSENDDGTPAEVNECDLAEAQWVSVYRSNPDHATTDKMPSEWVLDLDAGRCQASREHTNRVAQGLCELLNEIPPVDALHNPKLHVFFR